MLNLTRFLCQIFLRDCSLLHYQINLMKKVIYLNVENTQSYIQSKNSFQNIRKFFPSFDVKEQIFRKLSSFYHSLQKFQCLHFFSLCVEKQFLKQISLFLTVAHIMQNLIFHIQRRIYYI